MKEHPLHRGAAAVASAARPDRTSFFVTAATDPSVVHEIIHDTWVAAHVRCGGPVVQLAVSTTCTGQSVLGAVLESGQLEVWDIAVAAGGGMYTLREVVQVATAQDLAEGTSSSHKVAFLAGSRGLPMPVFFHVAGLAASGGSQTTLHIVQLLPTGPTQGTQRLAALDASRKKAAVVALVCHDSRPLLCVGFADGVLHLYSTGSLGAEGEGGDRGDDTSGPGADMQRAAMGAHEEDDDNEEEEEEEEEEGIDDGDSTEGDDKEGKAPPATLGKVARKLLLPPVAAFKFFSHMQGALSAMCLSPESGLILAGSTRGEVAVWSTNKLLLEAAAQGKGGGDHVLGLASAVLPLQSGTVASPQLVSQVGFLKGASPLVFATVQDDEDDEAGGVLRGVLWAILPKALLAVQTGPALCARPLAGQGRNASLLLLLESHGGTDAPLTKVAQLTDLLSFPSPWTPPSRLAVIGPSGPLPCAAFWGAQASPSDATRMVYTVQSRMTLAVRSNASTMPNKSKKTGPTVRASLVFKSLLVARPLHSQAVPDATAAFLLPTSGSEFRALLAGLGLERAVSLPWDPDQDDEQTMLLPHRLVISPDGATLLVLLHVVRSQQTGGTPSPPQLAHLMLRSAVDGGLDASNCSRDGKARRLTLLHAGLATDAAFLSSRNLALLRPHTVDAKGTPGPVLTCLHASGNPHVAATTWAPQLSQDQLWEDITKTHAVQRVFAVSPSEEGGVPNPPVLYVMQLQQSEGAAESPPFLALAGSRTAGLAPEGLGPVFALRDRETVLEVLPQTGLAAEGQKSGLAGMLAVLTSQRLLVLSPQLTLLAAAEVSSVGESSPPCSLLFLGLTPLVAHPDGRVLYLCAYPGGQATAAKMRPVCSLSQTQAEAGITLIVALPDRLVYAAKVGVAGSVRVLMRPLLPLEPLVLGLLAWPQLCGGTNTQEETLAVRAALQAVLERYGPLARHGVSGYGPGEGPGASAGATGWTCAALSDAGLFTWAAALAGVGGSVHQQQQQASDALPRCPWIPVDVKAGLAAQNLQWRQALREALGEDALAQAYALHPDASQSTALPPRFGRLSHLLAQLGREAQAAGQAEDALRLLDVAGDDASVVELLLLHLLGGKGKKNAPTLEGWKSLLQDTLKSRAEPHLVGWVRNAATSSSAKEEQEKREAAGQAVGGKLSDQVSPFASQRRQSLLPRLPMDQELPGWPQDASASVIPFGVAGSPVRTSRVQRLALDRVEEWLGRAAPARLREGVPGGGEESESAGGGDSGAAGQEDWVKGVGQGREEEDKVIFYWRFNEPMPAATEHPRVGLSPPPLAVGGDLSQYAHTARLVLDAPDTVTFVESTCPIDQGDDGKVRLGMDALWAPAEVLGSVPDTAPCRSLCRGLTVAVPRGSALDVGPYHAVQQHPGRSRLTGELWVQHSTAPDVSTAAAKVLLARRTCDAGRPVCVWALGVSPDGALLFWTDKGKPGQPQQQHEQMVATAPGTVPEGKWTHVAFTLESKGPAGKQALVVLYVGGKEAAATPTPLKFPTLAEAQLRSTVLDIGPNLRGDRMTELRLWACARSAEDLYDNRESYLQLAEKRKRLAFKIKTGLGGSSQAASEGTGGAGPERSASTTTPFIKAPASAPSLLTMPSPPPPSGLLPQPGCTPRAFPLRRRAGGARGTPSPTIQGSVNNDDGRGPTSAAPGSAAALLLPPLAQPGLAPPRDPAPRLPRPSMASSAGGGLAAPPPEPLAPASPLPVRPPSPDLRLDPVEVNVEPTNLLRDSTAPSFSLDGRCLCLREANPGGQTELSIVVLTLGVSGQKLARRDRYPFQADSSILVGELVVKEEQTTSSPTSSPFIACYTMARTAAVPTTNQEQGVLQVFDLAERKGVARQPVQTRVLFWRWVARRELALVTHRAVFVWAVGNGGGASPIPPAKAFDRQDVAVLGGSPQVLGYHQAAQGEWGVLTTKAAHQAAIQFRHLRHGIGLMETGADLVAGDVGSCGDRVYFLLLRCPAATRSTLGEVEVCVQEHDQASTLTRVACLPLLPPPLPSPLPPEPVARAWVLFPPTRDGDVVFILLARHGLLYACCPGMQRVDYRGSVFPPGATATGATVSDVSWGEGGQLLVLEAETFRVWGTTL